MRMRVAIVATHKATFITFSVLPRQDRPVEQATLRRYTATNPTVRTRNARVIKIGRYGTSAFTWFAVAPAPTPRTPISKGPLQHNEDRNAESSEPMAVILTFTLFTSFSPWKSG